MTLRVVVHDRGRDLAGVVHDGESWADAARRTVASLHVEPVPVDLSAEIKHFLVDHDNRVTVRAMVATRRDFGTAAPSARRRAACGETAIASSVSRPT